MANASTGNLSQLTNNQFDDYHPVWSPDGAHIAHTRMYPSEIFIVDADGSNLVQLTDNDSRQVNVNDYFYTNPLWSPDGSRVAYTRLENPYDQVLVVDADDPSPRLLISDVSAIRDLWWSPNGDLLAFLKYSPASGDLEIFVMDVADATVRQLTTDNHGYRHLAWSPDGSRIAYTGKVNDRREILTIDADGAGPRQLTQEGGHTPIWSPDGSQIAIQRYSDIHESSIYVMNSDGSQPRMISGAIPDTWKPGSRADGLPQALSSKVARPRHRPVTHPRLVADHVATH